MLLQTVALRDVKFHAHHGFYPEEQLTGNNFMVDVEVTFIPQGDTEDLDKTVNYEVINQILVEEMQQTQELLETVVHNILNKLTTNYAFIKTASVGIRKLNPPMIGEVGHSFVQLKYTAE